MTVTRFRKKFFPTLDRLDEYEVSDSFAISPSCEFSNTDRYLVADTIQLTISELPFLKGNNVLST